MKRFRGLTPLLALFSLFFALSAAGSAAAVALEIDVQARVVSAGEPLRVDVHSPVALSKLSGHFLGQPFALLPLGDGRHWRGWSLVPLDNEAADATIELRGRTLDGGEAHATHALTIREKRFPEENLDVAPRFVEPPKQERERIARERQQLEKVYATVSSPTKIQGPFLRPVNGKNTSVFGMRRLFNGKPRSPHPGLDLRAATGTDVRAAGGGRVVLAQSLYYAGNTVILDHGGQLFTIYAHLSRIDVESGQPVERGEVVGLSGATGRVTGPHLHWGAKIGDLPFDPEALLSPKLFADRARR